MAGPFDGESVDQEIDSGWIVVSGHRLLSAA